VKEVENIPIVQEFPDVFPEDLPGLPPDRDVQFSIELKLWTAPNSRRAYRMAPKELDELKKPNYRSCWRRVLFNQFISMGLPSLICEK